MTFFEGLRSAFRSLRSNKLRAGLTMLGIIVGIAAVISVVTIGLGGKEAIRLEMEKTGVNLFILYPKAGTATVLQESERLTLQDADSVKRALPQLEYLLPASVQYAEVQANQRRGNAMVVGTTPDFASLRRREVAKGRFFSQEEFGSDRRVAVIDDSLATSIFGAGDPLGQNVMLGNVPYRVIGVLAKDKSVFAQFDSGPKNSYTYVPWGSWANTFGTRRVDQLEGATYSAEELEGTIASAKRILNLRHGTKDKYEVFNVQQMVQSANKITQIMTLIIGLVAAISLLVGGIGIMNIMLVSVTERTREIGLRKALGAKEKDILGQFLLEAIALSLSGGIIGIALGSASALVVARVLHWPGLISGWAVVLAVSFSIAVGLFFGYYPARKAAKLEPIAALRYE